MIKGLLFILLGSHSILSAEVFLVTFKGTKAYVEPQNQKGQFISLTLKNDTFQRLRGELRNQSDVLKRYSLKPGFSISYQIQHSEYKRLYLKNLSPAFHSIPLKLGTKNYAFPE